jgi:putative intracellular protease/amidase
MPLVHRRTVAVVAALTVVLVTRPSAADEATPITVALYVGEGAFGKGPPMIEATAKKRKDLAVIRVTADDIKAGKLKGFRVLIMPGGTGSAQGTALGTEGRDAVKAFVRGGGVYVGICAGCYLASTGYPWSLDLLPAKVIDRAHWKRGTGDLTIELTPDGRDWMNRKADRFLVCRYANGPVLEPLPDAKEKLLVFAHFREEFVPDGGKSGIMVDTPAAVAARYGKGWAIGVSPHPEQSDGLDDLIPAAIKKALASPAP